MSCENCEERVKGGEMDNVSKAALIVAGGVSAGLLIGFALNGDGFGTTATGAGTPRPSAGVYVDSGARAAERAVGWRVIEPGTAASRYWAKHGMGLVDPYVRCEAALRVQFVDGYREPGEGREALWQTECGGVTGVERDSILTAAVEWSATHEKGDG